MREHGYTDIAVLMLMRYKFLLNWELGDAGKRRGLPPRMLRTRRESGIGKNPMYLTDTRIAINKDNLNWVYPCHPCRESWGDGVMA
jgi:hypothetical protein